jgi:hypothetical protein
MATLSVVPQQLTFPFATAYLKPEVEDQDDQPEFDFCERTVEDDGLHELAAA